MGMDVTLGTYIPPRLIPDPVDQAPGNDLTLPVPPQGIKVCNDAFADRRCAALMSEGNGNGNHRRRNASPTEFGGGNCRTRFATWNDQFRQIEHRSRGARVGRIGGSLVRIKQQLVLCQCFGEARASGRVVEWFGS